MIFEFSIAIVVRKSKFVPVDVMLVLNGSSKEARKVRVVVPIKEIKKGAFPQQAMLTDN